MRGQLNPGSPRRYVNRTGPAAVSYSLCIACLLFPILLPVRVCCCRIIGVPSESRGLDPVPAINQGGGVPPGGVSRTPGNPPALLSLLYFRSSPVFLSAL